MARRGEVARPVDIIEKKDDPRDKLEGRDRKEFEDFQKVLKETAPDFERMSLSLRKDIGNRYYDTILADDISGRLVGRFLHRLMHRDGEGDGYAPKLFFYAGGQDEDARRRVDADIAKLDSKLGKRVLIATELINAGGSIRFAREALEARNHNIGIASLSVLDGEGIRNARGGGLRRPRFYRGGSNRTSLHRVAGVGMRKDYEQGGRVVRHEDESAELVAAVRKEVHDLVDKIYDKYFAADAPKFRGY